MCNKTLDRISIEELKISGSLPQDRDIIPDMLCILFKQPDRSFKQQKAEYYL